LGPFLALRYSKLERASPMQAELDAVSVNEAGSAADRTPAGGLRSDGNAGTASM
jgi:hypothetical protein